MYSCGATGLASCTAIFLLSLENTISEGKKKITRLSQWFISLSITRVTVLPTLLLCQLPKLLKDAILPARPADVLGHFSNLPLCHVCKVKPCRYARNFPTLPLNQFLIISVPGSRSLHGCSNTFAGVRGRKSENRNKSDDFLQRYQLISPHCAYESMVSSYIAQSLLRLSAKSTKLELT